MKKLYLLLSICLFLFSNKSGAQSVFEKIKYVDQLQPGLKLELPNKPEVAQNTIISKLKEIGYEPESKGALFWKSNEINGFYIYKGVTLPDSKEQKLDLYFKVDERKGKTKHMSTVYLLVSKGYDNFVSPESDSAVFQAAKRFLNSFVAETAAFKLNIEIEAAESEMGKAEKKLKGLKEDEEDLKGKQQDINKDLEKNAAKQQTAEQELNEKKLQLKLLKDKQTNIPD